MDDKVFKKVSASEQPKERSSCGFRQRLLKKDDGAPASVTRLRTNEATPHWHRCTHEYYYVLDDYDPVDADVVFFDYDNDGDDDLFAALVTEDGDVVLGYGDPDGTLTEVVMDLGDDLDGDGVLDNEFDAESVAIYVDDDRLFLAATAADAVGWLFMGF